MQTIVIAWVEDGAEWDGQPYARDLGARPKFTPTRIAKACVWMNEGDEDHLAAARTYAMKDPARSVLTYPTTERDPIGRAKRDVLATEPPARSPRTPARP